MDTSPGRLDGRPQRSGLATRGVEHGPGETGKGTGLGQKPNGRRAGRGAIDLRSAAPVLLALALAAGAYVYFAVPAEPGWLIILGLIAVTGAGLIWMRTAQSVWLIVLVAMAFAAALGATHAKSVATRTGTITVPSEIGPVQLEGWVRQVEGGRNGPRLRISVHAIQGMDTDRTPALVRVTHPLSLAVGPGRFVRCRVVLRPPPSPSLPGDYDFRRQAFFEGLGAVGYVQGRCRGGALGRPGGWLSRSMLRIDGQRRRLAEHVNQAAGERAGGFAAALVSGDRSYMAQEDQNALRASGLAHLLAISGLHLAIVCGLVYLMVRRSLALIEPVALRLPVQKPAAAAALVAGAVYLVLSGASVSTQRAFIMAAIFFGAILFDRPGFSLRSFAVAMVAVVVMEPASVTSPGFQMSFAATGALIATYEAMNRARAEAPQIGGQSRVYQAAESLVVTSVVASLATAPFALYHFDRVAGAGLLANLLAMPIVSFVSAPAAGLTLVLAPIGLGDWGLALFGQSLAWVLSIAHWTAELPEQSLVPAWPMPGVAFGCLMIALVVWVVLQGWSRWAATALFTAGATAAWMGSKGADLHWSANGDLYVANADGVLRVEVTDGDGLGPLRYSDVPVGAICAEGVCNYASHRGQVRIEWIDGRPRVCARAGTEPGDCDRVIDWQDVETARGVTVRLDRPDASGSDCQPRPWIVCR